MPELPEVESLRRGLLGYLRDQKIQRIEVRKPKLVSGKGNKRSPSLKKTEEFVSELAGETIKNISRRAKNLIFEFKSGKILLVHLKMTGQLVYKEKDKKIIDGGHPIEKSEHTLPHAHTHLIFHLSRGVLYYNDPRMFGYLLYYPNQKELEVEGHFKKLGLEPLEERFTLSYFREKIKEKSQVLKSLLMNQEVVTGLGNIYCDEACFESGIRPNRRANTLTKKEVEKLYKMIKKIITLAIQEGGSSVANYRLADGSRGNYARKHKVYGRSGKPCLVCKNPLKKITIQSRTTIYCPHCQS